MHIYTYIHVRTHTHIHIYTHTRTKCTYERTQACLERRRGSERARSRCRERKLWTSLSFDAIKPHFAPPMQGLHCTHFLKHQYPSTPHPFFPTYPRTVRGRQACAVLLFYTDQMNKMHSSEEAPRSKTLRLSCSRSPARSCELGGGEALSTISHAFGVSSLRRRLECTGLFFAFSSFLSVSPPLCTRHSPIQPFQPR